MNVNNRIEANEAINHPWMKKFKHAENVDWEKEALNNLRDFNADQKMQQAVL